jgi:hypothetical protein
MMERLWQIDRQLGDLVGDLVIKEPAYHGQD